MTNDEHGSYESGLDQLIDKDQVRAEIKTLKADYEKVILDLNSQLNIAKAQIHALNDFKNQIQSRINYLVMQVNQILDHELLKDE